jgi:hypothetical protein
VNIEAFSNRYPAATAAIGAIGGAASWILDHLPVIQGVASCIGTIFGALTAMMSFWLLVTRRRDPGERPSDPGL